MSDSWVVETPRGPGRLDLLRAEAPRGTLILSHGAGRGVDSPELQAIADGLPRHGWTVGLFEQPWRVAGRRVATAPPTLDQGLRAGVALALHETDRGLPLVVGGRSAGARSAARCAESLGAVGLLALAFPLHAPHRPERTRAGELSDAQVSTLVVQGARDALGSPEEFDGWFPGGLPAPSELVVVPMADHGFAVPRRGDVSQDSVWALIVESSVKWLTQLHGDPPRNPGNQF